MRSKNGAKSVNADLSFIQSLVISIISVEMTVNLLGITAASVVPTLVSDKDLHKFYPPEYRVRMIAACRKARRAMVSLQDAIDNTTRGVPQFPNNALLEKKVTGTRNWVPVTFCILVWKINFPSAPQFQ